MAALHSLTILAILTILPAFQSQFLSIVSPRSKNKVTCGNMDSFVQPYVMGGGPIPPGKYPWLVNIRTRDKIDQIQCAGSLVTGRLVITAAHCLYDRRSQKKLRKSKLWVYFWTDDIEKSNEKEMRVPIRRIVLHRKFRPKREYRNDIALVELSFPVHKASPICLPCPNSDAGKFSPRAKEKCWVVGWGQTENIFQDHSPVPIEAKLPIVEWRVCNSWKFWKNNLHKNMMCAGAKRRANACQGDSGSPLMCERGGHLYLSGVTSWGSFLCGQKPSVFTNVAKYSQWLSKTISKRDKTARASCTNKKKANSINWADFLTGFEGESPVVCDAAKFEHKSQLFFLGNMVKGNYKKTNIRSAEQCTFECCLVTKCNSVLYYSQVNECYLFLDRYCDVGPAKVDLDYSDNDVDYYGKTFC